MRTEEKKLRILAEVGIDGASVADVAQMAMLWEGMEWRQPSLSAPPWRVA